MSELAEPRLTRARRLEAALGEPLDLGPVARRRRRRRRIVPPIGGTFEGPQLDRGLVA